MEDTEFQQLVNQLHEAKKRKSKKDHKAILVAGREADAKRAEGEDEQLVKALVAATPVIGSKVACHMDLLRRQSKLPANVRAALLNLNVDGEG